MLALPWHCGTAGESRAPLLVSSEGTRKTGSASAVPALTQGERTSPAGEQWHPGEKAEPPGSAANQRKAREKCHRDGFGFFLRFILGGITACWHSKIPVTWHPSNIAKYTEKQRRTFIGCLPLSGFAICLVEVGETRSHLEDSCQRRDVKLACPQKPLHNQENMNKNQTVTNGAPLEFQ